MMQLGTNDSLPKICSWYSCYRFLFPGILVCSYTQRRILTALQQKKCVTEVQKSISGNIAIHRSHIATHCSGIEAQHQAGSFSTRFAQSSRNFSHRWPWTLRVDQGHGCHCESLACCFFRRVQGIVTKEGMLLKTSIISAAAGALLLLALLRLHGRASLDSCSSRASRDHKARTGRRDLVNMFG